jgi:hypothetical protein
MFGTTSLRVKEEAVEDPSRRQDTVTTAQSRRTILDLDKIIAELKREREKIGRAIAALLEGAAVRSKGTTRKAGRKRQGGITAEGRRRLSLAMKQRWADRRAKKTSTKTAVPKRRGRLTTAGRKRLSEAMKKRWAERKRKAS